MTEQIEVDFAEIDKAWGTLFNTIFSLQPRFRQELAEELYKLQQEIMKELEKNNV